MVVRLPDELLREVDRVATEQDMSRARAIRGLLADALFIAGNDGIDRAQIQRMLAMTPRERIQQLATVVNAQSPLRGESRGRR